MTVELLPQRGFVVRTFAAIAPLLLLAGIAFAQNPAAQINTQEDVIRPTPTRTADQSDEPSAADPDLGELAIVSRTPRPDMFTFSTNQEFYYTSNAFLVPNGEQSTLFWNGRFDASYVPYATRDFTPRLTFEQNFFRYQRVSELDFDSQSLQLDLKYDLKRDDSWFVNLSYAVARLYAPHSEVEEFYRYGLATASITHVRQLGRTPVYFAGSFGSTWRHGDPSAFDRVTAYVNAAFFYSPLEHFQLTAFVRPEGQLYTNDPIKASRKDLNLNVGASAVLTPVEYVSLGVTASFIGNYSTSAPAEYDVFSPSLVIGGRIAF
jgi:hypothetical protein